MKVTPQPYDISYKAISSECPFNLATMQKINVGVILGFNNPCKLKALKCYAAIQNIQGAQNPYGSTIQTDSGSKKT